MKDRTRALITGVAAGALLGAALAWVATDGYDEASSSENPIKALGPGDYLALVIGIMTLARQFGAMLKRTT
ncbi:MAG: hypothetical protein IT329_10245 [Caldilineaceae bacterium]|nr:hypothetical protein [Caldilineaceae bacterium]